MVSTFSAIMLSLVLLFSIQSLCSSALEAAAPSIPPPPEKVSLSLYYETLCPGCTDFIIKDLPKIFYKGLIDIVDLNPVPYGNAFLDQNNNIICQDGPKECFLNTVEACAIHVWPVLKEHFRFIYCLEDYISKGESSGWGSCLRRMPLQGKPIRPVPMGVG
ncbi:gamma-interferon-responsive lysosomal thiol protein-like [Papaver somniferum]|uniref:gamma-interferon-responsive lysosomal thiol protein-like n=1 Tax=Papaver somniferum TaxID=3469 RepID=UPI000E7045E2|nr:gamma-interferon-responsive lysosomal thiol protein-like [Papaver somniferum]